MLVAGEVGVAVREWVKVTVVVPVAVWVAVSDKVQVAEGVADGAWVLLTRQ